MFSRIERSLLAKIEAGSHPSKLKTPFLKQFEITARQFNSVHIQLKGRINSLKARYPQLICEHNERISRLKHTIKKLERHKKKRELLHQKKRRLHRLTAKAARLKQEVSRGKLPLCFGSRKLFRAQFALEKNGFESHHEWKQAWQQARASQFFLVGSKDETASNQSCQATLGKDGSLNLKLRLPNRLAKQHGKYLTLSGITFAYGHNQILDSLEKGRAISYRFHRDRKGWRIFAMTAREDPHHITKQDRGAIGVDINANHIALVETDRFGNPIFKKTLPFNTYGKRKEQNLAMIGDLSAAIVSWAKEVKKPLVIEELNFQKKKGRLKESGSSKYARMLSSFTYTNLFHHLHSRASRHGVELITVNPAYTSVIGRVKFAKRYGLSTHHAASLTIARRQYRFSEQPPLSAVIPDGKGDYVTLSLPVRNRGKHVWSFWGRSIKKISAALAEHFRAMKNRSKDPHPADPCDRKLPNLVGAIPTCESLATLLG